MRRLELRVLLAAAAVLGFGFLLKEPCAPDAWGGSAADYYRLCYSDIGPLYFLRGFADGVFPYFGSFDGGYLEYPVLIGLWAWLTAALIGPFGASVVAFVHLTWAASAGMLLVTVWLLSKWSGLEGRAKWFALSPALLLTVTINWDALAVLAAVAGLWWWQRNRPGWAGVAIGIGVAAKLYPALLLIPMLIDGYESGRWRAGARAALAAAGTWLAINLPFILFARDGWWEFFRFSRERGIDFGSPWLALRYLADLDFSTGFANLAGVVAMAIAIAALFLLRKRLDVATAGFALVAVFALVNKVYSPQYWLWLTPLAALSAVRLREFAIWQLAELGYFIGIWRYLLHYADPTWDGAIGDRTYGLVIAVHWLATAWLVGVAGWRSGKSRSSAMASGTLRP